MGGIVLVLYGIIRTLQPATLNFGLIYAAYCGVFLVLSMLWGWEIDRKMPDAFELLGGLIYLIGVAVIMCWPRGQPWI